MQQVLDLENIEINTIVIRGNVRVQHPMLAINIPLGMIMK